MLATIWSAVLVHTEGRGLSFEVSIQARRVGPSTGTNLWGAFGLLSEMVADGRDGSVVTLLADSGDRYSDTYFCEEWLAKQGLDPAGSAEVLVEFEHSGRWPWSSGSPVSGPSDVTNNHNAARPKNPQ